MKKTLQNVLHILAITVSFHLMLSGLDLGFTKTNSVSIVLAMFYVAIIEIKNK